MRPPLEKKDVMTVQEAIDYYRNYQNSTGNSYANEANEIMNDALEFQNVRNGLVKDNPDLFK